jgi:DNA-binding XRE family transcriptional regulator
MELSNDMLIYRKVGKLMACVDFLWDGGLTPTAITNICNCPYRLQTSPQLGKILSKPASTSPAERGAYKDLLDTYTDLTANSADLPHFANCYQQGEIWMGYYAERAEIAKYPEQTESVKQNERARLGTMIREAREAKGLSQTELARLSDVPRTNISRIESGRYNVSIDTISRLGAVLGVKIALVPSVDD